MYHMKLRKRIPLSYFEPDEPSFDEYVYCEKCCDFVYEYCSIHGALLVIPDDKVLVTHHLGVPHSALTIPQTFLHLAPSVIPGAGIGVFASMTLPRGVRFGPYNGTKTQKVESMYCWQIFKDNNIRSLVIDASDASESNWMRYVNCARHWCEQNLIAYQYRGQLYYRSIKPIPRFSELLVFYGGESAAAIGVDLRRYNDEEAGYYHITDQTTKQIKSTEIYEDYNHNDTLTINVATSVDFKVMEACIEENSNIGYEDSENVPDIQQTGSNPFEDAAQHDSEYYGSVEYKMENKENKLVIGNMGHENGKPKNVCKICFKSFKSVYNLKRHYLTHNIDGKCFEIPCISGQRYTCETCGYPCDNNGNLKRHIERKHKKPRVEKKNALIKCPFCDKSGGKKWLASHVPRHVVLKKHNCTKCTFKTDFIHIFNQHLRGHLSEKVYKCDTCSYATFRRDSIVRHVMVHYKNKV